MPLDKKNINNSVIMVMFLTWTVGYLSKNAINVASISIAKEFSLNPSQVGMIMSSFFLSYAFMTLVGGYFADRFGARKALTIMMITWAIATLFTGIAWSFGSIIVMRFLFGLCAGGFSSASSVAIAELFHKEKRGRAKSLVVSAGSVASALGPITVAALTISVGWRSAFRLFGILGILMAVVFFVIYKNAQPIEENEDVKGEKKDVTKAPLKELLKVPFVWKLAVMQFALGVFMWGLNSWMPSYWMKVRHLNMVTMGALSAIPWITSFILMNFSGYFLDKYLVGKEGKFLGIVFAIGAVFTYLCFIAPNVPLAFTYLTVVTVSMSVASPAIFVLPLKYLKREQVASASGIAGFGQQFAGIVAPTMMGYMISLFKGSYFAVFGIVIATVLIAMVLAFTVNTKQYLDSDANNTNKKAIV